MIEYPDGTPSWVDLSSPDLDASARFYGELFGWKAVASGPPEQTGGYRMFLKDGATVAGLGPAQEGVPPSWTTYVSVGDPAAARERVEAAGGTTLVEPLTVMDAGTMAVFADPAGGAVFAVWQPDRHRGAELVNAPGALTMNELDTRDPDGAARFYGAVFGWEYEPVEQDGAVVYGQLKLGGRLVAGLLPMGSAFPAHMPVTWLTYFGVEDLDAAASRAQQLGGRALAGPREVPQGRFTPMADPHGATFALWEGQYDPPPGRSGSAAARR